MHSISGWKTFIVLVIPAARYLIYLSTTAFAVPSPALIAAKASLADTWSPVIECISDSGCSFIASIVILISPVAEEYTSKQP